MVTVSSSRVVFDQNQCVEPFEQDGVDVDEVDRDDVLGLGAQEGAPGRSRAPRRRTETRVVQDLPDGGRGDVVAAPVQLALDTAVAQSGLSFAMAMTSLRIAAVDGRPGERRAL